MSDLRKWRGEMVGYLADLALATTYMFRQHGPGNRHVGEPQDYLRRDTVMTVVLAMRRALDSLALHEGHVVIAAHNLRVAQRAYMADRGNDTKGRIVGEMAAKLDVALEPFTIHPMVTALRHHAGTRESLQDPREMLETKGPEEL